MKRLAFMGLILIIAILTMLPLGASSESDYIKYAEFNPTYKALCDALVVDVKTHYTQTPISWVDLLAILGAEYGGDFSKYKTAHLKEYERRLTEGEALEEITKDMEFFDYYQEVYSAVLGGFLGEYTKTIVNEDGTEETETGYGLVVYSPIAASFPYSHYDDFGASRSYGYQRQHLGHDLMAATGTPVIAIEDGVVEVMGWNQYGGWRIGIRSNDSKRYYYYAHLRQNRPYHCDLEVGDNVKAGEVIGYVGRTGYSTAENTNGIEVSHLHLGLELVFDESQKESENEIWVDMYAITKLLENNKSTVTRIAETKEFYSDGQIAQKTLENSENPEKNTN